MSTAAKCPICKSAKQARPLAFHRFYCSKCGVEFEDVDDGTIGRGRPDRNAESKEEFLLRQKARKSQPAHNARKHDHARYR